MDWALQAIGLTKRYGPVLANEGVDLRVRPGEVHAVMGENGAGKSTLMAMLYGLVQPDEGRLLLHGRARRFGSPLDAIEAGMGMVHQAFQLFEELTVWENVVYGAEPRRGPWLDRRRARVEVAALAERHGLQVETGALIRELPVGIRQRVEILKALYRDASVLILDEPTAVLTPGERDALFAVLRSLRADGRTILLVTHKLAEVMEISDHVTVLRRGRVVARTATAESSEAQIAAAMTGRAAYPELRRTPAAPGAPVLRVTELTVGRGPKPALRTVSFAVRAGEIVGIAGVAGNGQDALVQAIIGLRPVASGRVRLDEHDITAVPVARARAAGIAYIPEDRAATGTAAGASAADNLLMGRQGEAGLSRRGILRGNAILVRARRLIARNDVRIASEHVAVGTLSGGNLQKIVVARELDRGAALLIAEQPTRGVDVGAIEAIHARLIAERDAGRAVLLVSAELSEILALSDRVLVMYEGRILAEMPVAEASQERLGPLMAGQVEAAA